VASEGLIDEGFYKKSEPEEKIRGRERVKTGKGQRTGPR